VKHSTSKGKSGTGIKVLGSKPHMRNTQPQKGKNNHTEKKKRFLKKKNLVRSFRDIFTFPKEKHCRENSKKKGGNEKLQGEK